MIERIHPRRVVCQGRQRRSPLRAVVAVALACVGLFALLPWFHDARATAQGAPGARDAHIEADDERFHAHVPGSVTLAAMIEIQHAARLRRAVGSARMAPSPAKPGAWTAQLGAFGTAEAAERQRARLIEAGVPAVVRQQGALHRLQGVPAPRTAAEALCARAQASGIDCFLRQSTEIL